MRVWLAWRSEDEAAKRSANVGDRMVEIFEELAGRPLRHTGLGLGPVGVAAVELLWPGWKPAFFS
jgi:hypothetical protein